MRCNHCQSSMDQTDSIVEGRARQTWYRCPVCSSEQTISQPCEALVTRVGNVQRCSCDRPNRESVDFRNLL